MRAIPQETFEALVAEAIEGLPDEFLDRLDNVGIVAADWPTEEQRRHHHLSPRDTLLGLYEGVALTDRESYGMVLPDKITIFQRPLEGISENEEDLIYQVQVTVVHEIAHHFGINDERLHELGY
jgi:predicted Zn-dependent protease with MMP-like domain